MPSRRSGFSLSLPTLVGFVLLVLIVGAGAFLANQYSRPFPALAAQPRVEAQRTIGTPPNLPWPGKGSAAVSVKGFSFVETRGGEVPRPIASTAKIMTAVLTLENHPLTLGQPGPSVSIVPQDVTDFNKAIREGQSAVPVMAGEKLSELQLLQALLIPSGNNIADIMAKWDSGSTEAFVAKMNARAAALGMSHTHYDDASGFSPKTVSTPADLITLGAVAMADPVFRGVVAMDQFTIPLVGVVKNYNTILGKDGNIGIKTGSTDEAGGCFVSASIQQVAGKPMEIYAAVLGEDELDKALNATTALSKAAASSFVQARLLNRTDVVGMLSSAWGEQVDVVPSQDVETLAWPGTALKTSLQFDPVQAPLAAGAKVGTLSLEFGKETRKVDVVAAAPIAEPSWQWRATRFMRGQ